MVTVKEAAQGALAFAREVLLDGRTSSLLLEEVDLSETGNEWLVTVSVPAPRIAGNSLGMLAAASGITPEPRDYKLIRVDAFTGSPKSLTIRQL
jgi:hypothetical protein